MENTKKLRIGVFGYQRGAALASQVPVCGSELVAVCEKWPDRLESARKSGKFTPDAGYYTDFDEFIKHDMDAVILANYWHQHADYAIKAMRAGKDVLSETTAANTLAKCVELVRTVEETGRKYMLEENFAYMAENVTMRRIYQGGSLGRVLYAEGEYVHPGKFRMGNYPGNPSRYHWRKWLPCTSYATHAMAPLLYITGEKPVKVNAKAIYAPDILSQTSRYNADIAGILLTETESGAVFRTTGHAMWGPHGYWWRVCGSKGGVDKVRGMNDPTLVRLTYNPWDKPTPETPETQLIQATWEYPSLDNFAKKAGHGGGDFYVVYHFVRYLKQGIEPPFTVIPAVTLSALEIMAGRSVQNGGVAYDIPDFSKEEDRKKYENDTLFVTPDENHNVTYPCCSHPDYRPTPEAEKASEVPVY